MNGTRNALLFGPGATDIGAAVNAAFTDCSYSCTVEIPPGTYTIATTINMSYPTNVGGASLVGTGGSTATILTYTGTGNAIEFQTDGGLSGTIKGLSILHSGTSAAQSGLHTGSTIGSKLDDLTISGFNMCIHIENVNLGRGQDYYERNSLTNIEVSGCTYGIYVEATTGTNSLGYNHFYSVDTQPYAGQYGIYVKDGIYWYNGELINHCDSGGGECVHLEGGANLNGMLLSLTGEQNGTAPASVGIHLEDGANLNACGNISTFSVEDDNPPGDGSATTSGSMFVGACTTAPVWGGTVANWDGAGNSANLYPLAVHGVQSPFGLGFAQGTTTDINSVFIDIYSGSANNRFAVRATGYHQSWANGTDVWSADRSGNTSQLGNLNALGKVNAAQVISPFVTAGQSTSSGYPFWVHQSAGLNWTTANFTGGSAAATLSAVNDTASAFAPARIAGSTIDLVSTTNTLTAEGTLTVSQTVVAPTVQFTHTASSGTAPTVAVGSGAGSGASASLSSNSTDSSGFVTLNFGTTFAGDQPLFTVNFGTTWTAAPKCWVVPASLGTAIAYQLAAFVSPSGITTSSFTATLGLDPSPTSTTGNIWSYKCEQ